MRAADDIDDDDDVDDDVVDKLVLQNVRFSRRMMGMMILLHDRNRNSNRRISPRLDCCLGQLLMFVLFVLFDSLL